MAPCNGTTSTPPKLAATFPFPPDSTLQWHPAMAPSNGTTSAHSPKVGRHPPAHYNGTLQWHVLLQSWSSPSPAPTIAHYNGTLQWHHVHSPKVGRHPPPTIAHYNGTLQWHHVLLQSWLSPSPRNDSALQWHLAMAPSNGTTSTPPKLVVTLSPQP